jgi:2-polyprenyl-3-methyl-5-hydroxy-6-metoxy-1,4-benzoquinol methylase
MKDQDLFEHVQCLAELSINDLQTFLLEVIKRRLETLSPAQGLTFLLGLDASLYEFQGRLSVAYDGGLHTKHRHTRYHDFFTDRIRKKERVLDVGCGIGALAFDIARKSDAIVCGVDLNEDNITVARTRYHHPNVTYRLGDVLLLPFEGLFDVVILSNVLEHQDDRTEFLRYLVEVVGSGRLLVRVPLFERDWRVPLKRELGLEYRLDSTHCTEYTLESFASEMHQSGLRVVHQEVRWGEIWAEIKPGQSF